MPRLQPIDPAAAAGPARELLDRVQGSLGRVPNLAATMAVEPRVLNAYLQFRAAIADGALTGAEREAIALTVAGINGCSYCAAAHTAISQRMSVVPEEAARWLAGEASDPRLTAILAFVGEIVRQRTHVSDARIAALRQAGVTDAQMLEIVAHIALNTFTNTVNHVAQTAVDFPPVALPDTGTTA